MIYILVWIVKAFDKILILTKFSDVSIALFDEKLFDAILGDVVNNEFDGFVYVVYVVGDWSCWPVDVQTSLLFPAPSIKITKSK